MAKYEGSGIVTDVICTPEDQLWVPTSSPPLNYRLGGGSAYGRIMEIAGFEASGKSLMALDIIRSAQLLGGVGIFVDAEYAFDRAWAKLNGVDLDKCYIYKENIIESISDFTAEISVYYRNQLTENEPIVLVIDSVAALDTVLAMEASELDAKAEMGSRAKAIYKLLRIRNRLWAKLGITVIFINQLRDTINTGFAAKFQPKENTVGGRALKFYASQRIYLEAKKELTSGSKDKKHRYGVEVNLTVKKNKLAIPRSPARFEVIFDPGYGKLGFDRRTGLVDILLKEETLQKQGSRFYFDGEEIATSLPEMETLLDTDAELRAELLAAAKIKTINQIGDILDGMVDNEYPTEGITFDSHMGTQEGDEEDEDE